MFNQPVKEFNETVVEINRISKKTKGGNQIRFAALVVIGDKKGKVGVGISKAKDVRNSIRKAIENAKKNLKTIKFKGSTIPCSVRVKYGASKVLLKPAPLGSGIIAGGSMRVVLESAGIKNVVGKNLGGKSKVGSLRATLMALEKATLLNEKKEAIKNG